LESQQATAVSAADEKSQLAAQIADAHTRLAAAQAALVTLAAQEERWHSLRAALNRLEAERQAQLRELQQWQNRAAQIEKMRAEQTAVAQNVREAELALTAVTAEISSLAGLHQQHAASRAEKDTLVAGRDPMRELFKQKRERISQLEAQVGGDCPLCGQPLSADHRQNVLAQLQAELEEMEARGKANNERIESLTADIAALETRIKQSPKLEQQQQTQQDRKARAQARGQEIANSLAEWEAEGAERLAELETAVAEQSAIATHKQQVAELETAVQEKSRLDKERQELERQMANGEARLAEIERITLNWQQVGQAELETVNGRLERADFEAAAQAALADLDTQQEAVGYDAATHAAARAARDELADAPQRQQQLVQAQAAAKPLADALTDLAAQVTAQEQTIADFQQQVETAVAELDALTTDGADLHRLEDERNALSEEEIQANRQVGVAQNRLDVLSDQRSRQARLHTERVAQTELIQRMKVLEKAFGREGVQSLLIEQAIPEIEERANELLDRLTGGEMRVLLPTQRQNKTSETVRETLDIRIQDSVGERPYDNFSGGEQFRVNFAIRLALSQLLANRAGARLQTLVIDEGFGSQDPQGRQRLVEAINTIQDEFKVILVITHIDELRDVFPTRIEVEKRPSGSALVIS
jgi:exonuclease SbcC